MSLNGQANILSMAIKKLFIGLGSNLGDRLHQINSAKTQIIHLFNSNIICSSVYETEPWGFKEQQPFLNQVVALETSLHPTKIWNILATIENNMGRIRQVKFGPRSIDLDILLLNSQFYKNQTLTIPHPHLHQRRFVLIPLSELDANLIHPIYSKTIQELLTVCEDSSQVLKYHYHENKS